MKIFDKLGFVINVKESQLIPNTKIKLLGVMI